MTEHRTPLLREVAEDCATDDEYPALRDKAIAALAAEPQDLESRVYRREAMAHYRHLVELQRAVGDLLGTSPGSLEREKALERLEREHRRIKAEPPLDLTPADQALGGNAVGQPIPGKN